MLPFSSFLFFIPFRTLFLRGTLWDCAPVQRHSHCRSSFEKSALLIFTSPVYSGRFGADYPTIRNPPFLNDTKEKELLNPPLTKSPDLRNLRPGDFDLSSTISLNLLYSSASIPGIMLVFVVFSLHKSYVNKEIATIYKNMCVIVVRAYNKKFENLQFQNRSDKFKFIYSFFLSVLSVSFNA